MYYLCQKQKTEKKKPGIRVGEKSYVVFNISSNGRGTRGPILLERAKKPNIVSFLQWTTKKWCVKDVTQKKIGNGNKKKEKLLIQKILIM